MFQWRKSPFHNVVVFSFGFHGTNGFVVSTGVPVQKLLFISTKARDFSRHSGAQHTCLCHVGQAGYLYLLVRKTPFCQAPGEQVDPHSSKKAFKSNTVCCNMEVCKKWTHRLILSLGLSVFSSTWIILPPERTDSSSLDCGVHLESDKRFCSWTTNSSAV